MAAYQPRPTSKQTQLAMVAVHRSVSDLAETLSPLMSYVRSMHSGIGGPLEAGPLALLL